MAKQIGGNSTGTGTKPPMMGVGHPPARPVGVHGQTPATHNGGAEPQRKRAMPSAKANGRHGSGNLTRSGKGQRQIGGPAGGTHPGNMPSHPGMGDGDE